MGKARRKKPTRTAGDRSEAETLARIDRPLTLVAQVEQTLRRAIADGAFPGDRLPTEVELAERLGVSRETVRRATETLQREGLLVKYRRRGTFIRRPESPMAIETPPSMSIGYLQADYGAAAFRPDDATRSVSSLIFSGVLDEVGRHGYELIVRSATVSRMATAVDQLMFGRRLRGLMFGSVAEEKLMKRLGGTSLPMLLVDHDLHVPSVSSVRDDSEQGAALAVNHLADLGHRHIAYAHWEHEDLNRWRLRGYRQAMRDRDLTRKRAWECFVPISRAGAESVIEMLTQASPRPTAIYCFNNTLGRYVVSVAREQGLHVPEDLSVVGGGGEEVVNLTDHQVDWYGMGRQAAGLLLARIESPDDVAPEHVLVPHQLVSGSTTAPL